jgi:hypothetical protein
MIISALPHTIETAGGLRSSSQGAMIREDRSFSFRSSDSDPNNPERDLSKRFQIKGLGSMGLRGVIRSTAALTAVLA